MLAASMAMTSPSTSSWHSEDAEKMKWIVTSIGWDGLVQSVNEEHSHMAAANRAERESNSLAVMEVRIKKEEK